MARSVVNMPTLNILDDVPASVLCSPGKFEIYCSLETSGASQNPVTMSPGFTPVHSGTTPRFTPINANTTTRFPTTNPRFTPINPNTTTRFPTTIQTLAPISTTANMSVNQIARAGQNTAEYASPGRVVGTGQPTNLPQPPVQRFALMEPSTTTRGDAYLANMVSQFNAFSTAPCHANHTITYPGGLKINGVFHHDSCGCSFCFQYKLRNGGNIDEMAKRMAANER
ncbi:hypothetical protein LTR62_006762 [Meristemomyces frigidus]|uniref:Uncharacterized protein n=1 Tax=Meristemomyces frigidus TaxID=1508187 RepID=A0AAN7TQI3_9PEZI|nr:hypothetical protein LTR62_006762 [Meristemomyces frigidus]